MIRAGFGAWEKKGLKRDRFRVSMPKLPRLRGAEGDFHNSRLDAVRAHYLCQTRPLSPTSARSQPRGLLCAISSCPSWYPPVGREKR